MAKEMQQMTETFQTLFRDARERERLSQESVARRLEVSRNTVINWEAGKALPSAESIAPICRLLKLDPSQVVAALEQQKAA